MNTTNSSGLKAAFSDFVYHVVVPGTIGVLAIGGMLITFSGLL